MGEEGDEGVSHIRAGWVDRLFHLGCVGGQLYAEHILKRMRQIDPELSSEDLESTGLSDGMTKEMFHTWSSATFEGYSEQEFAESFAQLCC